MAVNEIHKLHNFTPFHNDINLRFHGFSRRKEKWRNLKAENLTFSLHPVVDVQWSFSLTVSWLVPTVWKLCWCCVLADPHDQQVEGIPSKAGRVGITGNLYAICRAFSECRDLGLLPVHSRAPSFYVAASTLFRAFSNNVPIYFPVPLSLPSPVCQHR